MARWQGWWQPSLVRRLLLAQMVTVVLLWVLLAVVSAVQMSAEDSEADLDQMRQGAAMVLPLAQALAAQPELLRATMQRIDTFQRANLVPTGSTVGLQLPRIYLWWDGALVYRSADAQPTLAVERTGGSFEVSVDGQPWRAYAEDSIDNRARFAALAPATAEGAGLTPWSRSWLLLPLLVSLPVLVLPAWLSVRLALRPWVRVSGEIAAREPNDLTPLQFKPTHRELSPLTNAVNLLLERLRIARERERSLIADAAHELRTPIAAMRVHAEALQTQGTALHTQELLQGLLASNRRASRLVAQLLALARSEAAAGAGALASLDLEPLLQDSLAQLATMAQARGVELDLATSPGLLVHGHGESLLTLVDNVVGNAIKYSPAGSTVTVTAQAGQDGVTLRVLDAGPGIVPELRSRVFDRFYRVPGQEQPGSGLGLSIAKSIADGHGAQLGLGAGSGGFGLCVTLVLQPAHVSKTEPTTEPTTA